MEKLVDKFEEAKAYFDEQNFVIKDKKLKAILASIQLGLPILAVGPTGSGKTHFFSLLAKFVGGTYDYASLNGSVTIHDLTQERIIGDNGFEEKDMILAHWLRHSQKGLSILQLDEVNAAKPETLLALHPIMDIKGELKLPYTEEVLPVSKNSVLIMSCNEGDEYSGINAMNMAFQNRYIKIHFPYLQGSELANILTKKTKVPIEQTTQIVETWSKYMSSRDVEQPVISIRMLEYWCELSHLLGLREAGEVTFAGLIAKDEDELNEILEGDFFVNLPN
jgi:midasin (ATPase involved in ribosome maturation)